MKPTHWIATVAVLSAGCASTIENSSPSIREALDRKQPAPEELTVQQSTQIEANPQLALENYREIMKLQPDNETRAETLRRMADLQIEVEDVEPGTDDAALKNSIGIYQDLLKSNPDGKANDRVLYQLARAYQSLGETELSIDTLARLQTEYPNSSYASDSHFRRGELLFASNRLSEAAAEYRAVMALGDETPFYEAAEYKLAWSLYKQSDYEAAVAVLFTILDRDLPPDPSSDPQAAVEATAGGKRALVKDVLRVTSLSFAAMGGGSAMNGYLDSHEEPAYYPLLYRSLGDQLLEQERYNDAGEAYAAFVQRHSNDLLAPEFQASVIDAYRQGGFAELIIREKERYANTYDPRAPYWKGRPVPDEVMTALRQHFDDLAKYYHSQASADPETRSGDFLTAASWYRRLLDVFPDDPAAPENNFLLGETLYAGGKTLEAAQQYTRTAYDYPPHPRSAEAAYAAVLAYQQYAAKVPAEERPEALRLAIDSGKRFAAAHPQHPQALPVLTRATEDLFEIKAFDESVTVAQQVLTAQPAAPAPLRRTALAVSADAEFTQEDYPASEAAYAALLRMVPVQEAEEHERVTEQLAASIYKQAEAARAAGDQRAATEQFLRVGKITPNASIRANADYDAAASLIELEDWAGAATVLESFRSRFPQHEFVADVDKKLAVSYERDTQPVQAAIAYQRIANRDTESQDVRREAAWKSAQLYDEAKRSGDAAGAYESYVRAYPQPVDSAFAARQRLTEIYKAQGNTSQYRYWLGQVVAADAQAGAARSDATRLAAARASLELGRMEAQRARALRLSLPIEQSLPPKREAMQSSIDTLSAAADYGFAEVTTAATLELGDLYRAFGRALMESERPRNLDDLALEQYDLLLEEQAYPFEEKSIEWYETNLKRIRKGVYDKSVKKSYDALVDIAPGQYAKRMKAEEYYDALR